MANFSEAYAIVKRNEGGYVNNLSDKGGETYAGIARNFNPSWPGWIYIDMKKRTEGANLNLVPCVRGCAWFNKKWPDIQHLVEDFYRARWNANRMGEINSQEIANLLFDYHVHSGAHAIRAIQMLVNVNADGRMGPVTLAAINNANAAQLHDALKAQRVQFLQTLAIGNQSQFAAGWMARLAQFPDMFNGPAATGLLLLGAALVTLFLLSQNVRPSAG